MYLTILLFYIIPIIIFLSIYTIIWFKYDTRRVKNYLTFNKKINNIYIPPISMILIPLVNCVILIIWLADDIIPILIFKNEKE